METFDLGGSIAVWRRFKRALRRHPVHELPGLLVKNAVHFGKGALTLHSGGFAREDEFDEKFGTDTCTIREVGSLDIESPDAEHAVRYQPSDTELAEGLLSRLRINHGEFTFIDFGSGKGKILLMASKYPFEAILGVEFSCELHEIARRNLALAKGPWQRCQVVRPILADATQFPIPDEPLVCYFYNPFGAPVFREVVRRLEASIRRFPRPVYVIYVDPVHVDVMVDSGIWLCAERTTTYAVFRSQ